MRRKTKTNKQKQTNDKTHIHTFCRNREDNIYGSLGQPIKYSIMAKQGRKKRKKQDRKRGQGKESEGRKTEEGRGIKRKEFRRNTH